MKGLLTLLCLMISITLLGQSKLENVNKRLVVNQTAISSIQKSASAMIMAGSACSATVDANVKLISCATVGKKGFDKSTLTTSTTSSTSVSAPSTYGATNPSCTNKDYDDNGQWMHFSLDAGVETIYLESTGSVLGGFGAGLNDVYATFYQGANCNGLTEIGCETFIENLTVTPMTIDGLNSNQDVWVYFYGDDYWNTAVLTVHGMPSATNDDCASAATDVTVGCNVGAGTAVWGGSDAAVGPESTWAGGDANTCSGTSSWISNENTVYYAVNATSANASIEIDNLTCNNGKSGEAQFGLFDDCSCFMSADYVNDACFQGCASSAVPLTITLTPGESYIIAVDGFAGDFCRWDFIYSGVTPLANESINFIISRKENDVLLKWSVETNDNISHFLVSRTGVDGETQTEVSYTGADKIYFTDKDLREGMYLYKIIQVYSNGEEIESEIRSVNIKQTSPVVNMNTISSEVEISLPSSARAMYSATIYNNIGQEVIFKNVSGTHNRISLSNFNNGIYYVVVRSIATNEAFSYKILK